jgi:hypothetical protein
MALRTAARLDAQRNDAVANNDPASAAQASLTDKLMAFIPAEILAPTVALFGFFAADSWIWRAVIVVVCVVLTPLWVWINYVQAAQTAKAKKQWPWISALFGIVAYLIWIGSVPGSPYLQWHVWSLRIGTGVVLIGAVLLVAASQAIDTWHQRKAAAAQDEPGGDPGAAPAAAQGSP